MEDRRDLFWPQGLDKAFSRIRDRVRIEDASRSFARLSGLEFMALSLQDLEGFFIAFPTLKRGASNHCASGASARG